LLLLYLTNLRTAIEAQRSHRHLYPLTLVYLDVDDFKAVNDIYGHQTGDKMLVQVAQTLKQSVRSHDVVARFGGDEFTLFLPQTDFTQAQAVLARTSEQLNTLKQQCHWPIGYSIGAMTFLTVPPSVDFMIAQVDHLMYDIKHHGKGRLECREFSG
jgi:diguanylate cyclase (GGDEF)-like protein